MPAGSAAVAAKPGAKDAHGKPAALVLPFTRVAKEHTEQIAFDTSTVMSTASQGPFSIEVPATGYLRNVVLIVNVTGGVGASAAAPDSPWNVLTNITLTDAGGAPIVEAIDGYELYLIAKYGGYVFAPDPALQASFSNTIATNGNFAFAIRVPVEVGAGVAALANMNAAQPYRLNYRVNASATVYTTSPTTLPTVRVRAVLESWTSPADGSTPPMYGATQLWSKQVYTINSGANTTRLQRVGNTIRNLLLIHRDSTGARSALLMPDPVTLAFDQRQQHVTPRAIRQLYATERYGFASLDVGVDNIDYTHDWDNHPGGAELHDLWMVSSQATRLEIQGVYGAAGTLTVLTNDLIIPASAAGV